MTWIKKILIVVILLFNCGCSDLKDLYNLTFPASMAVDYVEGEYVVTFQIINPNSLSKPEVESSFNKGEILITSSNAHSIGEAIQKLENKMRMEIKVEHIDTLFISPTMLELSHMKEVLNYFLHDQNLRLAASIFINDTDINEIFQVKHNISSSPYFSLIAYNSIDKLNVLEIPTSVLEIIKTFEADAKINIIPNLSVDKESTLINEGESQDAKRFEIKNLTILNHQTASTFKIEDIGGLMYINEKSNNDVNETIPYKDNGINYTILHSSTHTAFKNNRFQIILDTSLALESCPPELSEQQNIELINEAMKNEIYNTYKLLLENDIDYLNLHDLSHQEVKIDDIDIIINSQVELKNNYINHGGIE